MYKSHIHYDKQMEAAILGACLIDKFAFARVRGILTRDCFYAEGCKIIFDAISEMWEESFPIDLLTVVSRIVRNKGFAELDGENTPYYVAKLTNSVVSTANLEAHAFIIRQLYAERELLRIRHMPDDAKGDVIHRTQKIQDELFKLTQIKVTDDWKDISEVVVEVIEHMDKVKDQDIIGIPTGFEEFDLITSGLCEGQMIVLAARPSVGKSAFLGSLCINAATMGKKVGIISLEMTNTEIGARFGSLVSDVAFYRIFRNKFDEDAEREIVYQRLSEMSELPIKISEKTNVNVRDIKAKVSQLKSKNQLDILFVDYLQLLESDESDRSYSREQEVAKMSRGFKLMAKEFKIPIVVLAQLNRQSETTATKKPQLHNLRESGAIEQDADGVVFLHRDWKSGILTNADGTSTENEADLIIAKWRNGELRDIKIGFDGPKMRFYDKNNPYSHRKPQFKPVQNFRPQSNNFEENPF
jgi:replicative DNA helicase